MLYAVQYVLPAQTCTSLLVANMFQKTEVPRSEGLLVEIGLASPLHLGILHSPTNIFRTNHGLLLSRHRVKKAEIQSSDLAGRNTIHFWTQNTR